MQNKNSLPFFCAFPSKGSQNRIYSRAAAYICIWTQWERGCIKVRLAENQWSWRKCASLLTLQLTQLSGKKDCAGLACIGQSLSMLVVCVYWDWAKCAGFGNHHYPWRFPCKCYPSQIPLSIPSAGKRMCATWARILCHALEVMPMSGPAGRRASAGSLHMGNMMHTWCWLWQCTLPVLSGQDPAKPALFGSKPTPSFPLPVTNLNSLLSAQRTQWFSKKWERASSC